MQGNIGGPEEASYPPRNIDSGEEGARWLSTSTILTQGDKVEYKIKGVPGQTIFATVRSEVFDPALKLLDSKGKVVAENDDQYEGNQSPLLMFQFSDDKEYKLIVQNYRSSAGGRFKIYTQTFTPVEFAAGLNHKNLVSPDDQPGHGGHFVYFHFKATEGKTYGLRNVHFTTQGNNWNLRYRGIIGPTGVKKADYTLYDQDEKTGALFEAKTKGDFYVVYDSPSRDGVVDALLDLVEVTPLEKTGLAKFDLAPVSQRIFKMKVEKGDIIRTTIDAAAETNFQFRAYGQAEKDSEIIPHVDFETLQPVMTNDNDLYRMYQDKGEVVVLVTSNLNRPTTVVLTNKMDIPVWKDGTSISGRLELGESHFYTLSGIKGDIQKIRGKAEGFELDFQLMKVDGSSNEYRDPKTHQPSAELQYSDNLRYLVVVRSPQGGGSGTYNMSLDSAKPESLALGLPVDYHDGPALGTYSVEVEAGVRYQLLYRGRAGGFMFLDDKGDAIGFNRQQFGDQAALYFVPARKGVVRIKVQGGTADTRFRVDKHELPGLG